MNLEGLGVRTAGGDPVAADHAESSFTGGLSSNPTKKAIDERRHSELFSEEKDVPTVGEAVAKTAANVSFENIDHLVVLLRHCADVEAPLCRCDQEEGIVETELLNLDDVA